MGGHLRNSSSRTSRIGCVSACAMHILYSVCSFLRSHLGGVILRGTRTTCGGVHRACALGRAACLSLTVLLTQNTSGTYTTLRASKPCPGQDDECLGNCDATEIGMIRARAQ